MKRFTVALVLALVAVVIGARPASAQVPTGNTGQLTAAQQSLAVSCPGGNAAYTASIGGTFSATATFEATNDGTNWHNVYLAPYSSSVPAGTTTGSFYGSVVMQATAAFRVRVSAYTSGTVGVSISCAAGGTVANTFQILPVVPDSGLVTCTLATASACHQTATVTSGTFCRATYDAVATTITPVTDLLPIQLKVVGATLTVYMDTSASLSGNLAADYGCDT
jgi:hypothetical protein